MKTSAFTALAIGLFLMACGSPEYLEDTHYWNDGKIRVDWKWSTTSAKAGDNNQEALCLASAKITNLQTDSSVRVSGIILVLQNQHDLSLYENSESVDLMLSPKESKDIEMKFWVTSGIEKDVRSLGARLAFAVIPYDALLEGIPEE